VEDAVLSALRQTTPLTCGQGVAHQLVAEATEGRERVETPALVSALAEAVETARADGRPVERALLAEGTRRGRLSEALAWARRSEIAATGGPRSLLLAADRVARNELLLRCAREYASARESAL
jgi:hypothetical protein